MNILLVSDTYKPQINGVITALEIQFNSLKRKKIRTTLLVPQLKKYNNKDILTAPGLSYPFLPEYKISSMFSLKNLYRIRKRQIDLIHTHTPFSLGVYAIMLGKILKVPVVHTYHTYFEEYLHYIKMPPKTGRFTVHMYSKWYCNNMDHIIVPSNFMKTVLKRYQVKKNISVIPNGYNLKQFSSKKIIDWRKKYKIPKDGKVLLYVGRIAKEKNLYFLINIFNKLQKKYNDIYLMITGDGPEKERLIQYTSSKKLSDKIRFTGFINYKDIHNIFSLADIFVFPSKTETQGLVLIEAMLNNLPVVSFYARGTKIILPDHKSLGISPVRQDRNFIREIDFYLQNKYSKKELQNNLHQYVSRFDENKISDELICCYEKVIKKHKKN